MRVTSLMMVNNMKYNVNNNMSALEQLQYRTAKGMKFRYPSDDPIAVSRSLKYNTDISKSLQHLSNVNDSVSWMTTTEGALNEMKEIMRRAHELTVQAANGTNTQELDKIKVEIDELKESLIQLGNTAYAGRRLFSGFQTDKDLLDKDGNYNIDLDGSGKAGKKLADDGKEVFLYNTGIAENVEVNTLGSQVFGIWKVKPRYDESGNIIYDDKANYEVIGGATQISPPTPPTEVNLGKGSVGTAGDKKITGLTQDNKYVVEEGGKFYAVDENGDVQPTVYNTQTEALAHSKKLNGTEINVPDNEKIYRISGIRDDANKVSLDPISKGIAGDKKITDLAGKGKYVVQEGGKFYPVKADGSLDIPNAKINLDEAKKLAADLNNGVYAITGLDNDKIYAVHDVKVNIGSLSEGIAGNEKITGLKPDVVYVVKKGNKYYPVEANGTLDTTQAYDTQKDAEEHSQPLTVREITGLDNQNTYTVMESLTKVNLGEGSNGTAGYGKVTNLKPNEKYVVKKGDKYYAVKADGTLDTTAYDDKNDAMANSAPLTGTEITGLENSTPITDKVPAYENIDTVKGEKPYVITLFEKLSKDLENKDQAELRHDIELMKEAYNNTLSVNSEFGARVNRMKLTKTKLEDSIFNLKSLMSDNENVDLAEAFTELLTQENVYRASLGVTGRIIQPTLMDFLR